VKLTGDRPPVGAAAGRSRPPNVGCVPPDYPPSMQEIPFPAAAAAAAAAECRSLAKLIDEKMSAAALATVPLGPNWQGAYADDFKLAWPDTVMSGSDLIERLNRLAADIEAGAQAAAAENRRRADLRSEFRRESMRGR
jgi:hypothetical protein